MPSIYSVATLLPAISQQLSEFERRRKKRGRDEQKMEVKG